MSYSSIERHLFTLQGLYPEQVSGIAQPLPMEALDILPTWIKGAVRIYVASRLESPNEPFLYLAQPKLEIAFEQLIRIYRQLVEKLKAPILIIADNLPAKHRPLLVKFNIAFIYRNESVYAPDLGLKFDRISRFKEDRSIQVKSKKEAMTPFALKIVAGLLTDKIPREFTLKSLHAMLRNKGFEVSTTKISLALRELAKNGLLLSRGAGPTLCFANAAVGKTWDIILNSPIAPFFREAQTNYVPKDLGSFCLAGETALAQYSNLAASATTIIAMSVKEFREIYEKKDRNIPLVDIDTPRTIQIWKEPPLLFALEGVMNPIEVFFAMRNHHDERIQLALDEMLSQQGLTRK